MPQIPPPPERLGDALIELREIAEWDIPEVLIAHQDDRELHRRLGMARPPTGAQLGSEVERAEAQRLAGEALKLTIVHPGGNDCIGRVELHSIDWDRAAASLRVWVAPQFRGRGYEERAAELVLAWLRDTLGLSEVALQLLK